MLTRNETLEEVVAIVEGEALRKSTKRIDAERKIALTYVYLEIARGRELIGAT